MHKQQRRSSISYTRIIFVLLLISPTFLFGQDDNNKIFIATRGGLGDTAKRPVYFTAEIMPKLANGERIESYVQKQPRNCHYHCCAFKAYLGFVVEADGSVTNKMVYVRAVNCEYGLLYDGPEIKEMESNLLKILDKLPRCIPGKIDGKNVAVKVSFSLHEDCFMR